ncbi:2-hydroxychromene-2-carboxylate isomerase [Ruegeria lacuscaerulensis]|uniref:2-hydroxychromene-2-carboxylate isomerase n=1 Tax=Ruegeria lacuscaerulensis TaxID=55218 RepID=UPI00147EE1CE|nr:2-hydroxychromene-2-carboxylate isomerase [Ruegeria lacuscaerulensis]
MSQTLDFIYDFCSPNAFLAHKVMPKLVADHGVQINYVPVLLSTIFKATNNQSPFQAFSENRQKTAYLTHDLHRYARRRGVSFHMSPHFPINTKFAMRGAVFASGKQWEAKYIDAIFDAIWVHGQKADEITVLMDILQDNELPVRKLREAMTEPDVKQQLKDQSKNAAKRGVFGVPTFFASSEMFFGKNSLPNLELELSRSV